jgi:membrane-associated phospholipid phosphatase
LLVALLTGLELEAHAQVIHPWQRLGPSLERSYGFPNTLFHVGAAASTVPLVLWVDEPVQEELQEHDPFTDELGSIALVSGVAVPIAVPAVLYLGGLAAEDEELATAGAAVTQAMVIQFVAVHTLKWLTDRAGPFPDGDPSRERWSTGITRDSTSTKAFDFNPFNLEWGLRWPSGHTSATVTLVSSLFAFYPHELWIALVGYPLAAAVGVGMMEGDYHWLSDVVAGALIGHVIGYSVGSELRETYDAQGKPSARANRTFVPRITPTLAPLGARIGGLW